VVYCSNVFKCKHRYSSIYGASVLLDKTADATVEAKYLNTGKFKFLSFCSNTFRRTQSCEASSTFSNKLIRLVKELFTSTIDLNLSRLWPAFHKFTVGDSVMLEWKRYCELVDVELNRLFYQNVTEVVFKKMREKITVSSAQEE